MRFRLEFETVTSSLMSRKPLPSLDICLTELIREEQHIQTKAHLVQQKTKPYTIAMMLVKKHHLLSLHRLGTWAKSEYGHLATQCILKFSNYCKRRAIADHRLRLLKPMLPQQTPLLLMLHPHLSLHSLIFLLHLSLLKLFNNWLSLHSLHLASRVKLCFLP